MPSPKITFNSPTSLPSYARTAGRGVQLKIHPRPANIGESRKILSVLQKYGDLVSYQSMKYDPTSRAQNTVLALYRERAHADKLLGAVPLVLEMGSWGVREVPKTGQTGAGDAGTIDGETNCQICPSPASKEFHISVYRSGTNFYAQSHRQYYSGSFEPDRNTVMYEDLETRVPIPAMADCQLEKGEVPLRVRIKKLEQERQDGRGAFRESLWDMWKRRSNL